jgi:hypothetical protein
LNLNFPSGLSQMCLAGVQSSKMLNEEINNLVSGLRSNNSLAAFKAMEEKVAALEAEAEASSVVSLHLSASGWGKVPALSVVFHIGPCFYFKDS